jgi:hypothetical protein
MLTHDTLPELSNEELETVSATLLHEGDDAEEVTPVGDELTELAEEEVADEPGDEEEENEEEA